MKIGFIDYYLDEWHANNYPAKLKELSGGEIEVAYAFAEIDSPLPGGMTTDEWCEKNHIQRVDSIEELIALSDGIVVLSPDNCERHEQLCRLPLASGKRCYVDKTFAPDEKTARRIFQNAEEHGTPCYSSSALRFATEYATVKKEAIRSLSSWGPACGGGNGYEVYAIHQLEPIMMLMDSAPKRVMMHPIESWYAMTIEFEDGRYATLSGYTGGSPFMMNIQYDEGAQLVNVESDYFEEFLKSLADFFMTGDIKVPHETTVHIMAAREAGLRAMQQPDTWIEL